MMERQELRIGIEPEYRPTSSFNVYGKLDGLDFTIAQLMCRELNVEPRWAGSNYGFCCIGNLFSALERSQIDCIISSLSITASRKERVRFTKPYARTSARFLANANVKLEPGCDTEEFGGMTVGVQDGSAHAEYARNVLSREVELSIIGSQTKIESLEYLASGRVDMIFGDAAYLQGIREDFPSYQYLLVGPEFNDVGYFDQGFGVAVRKGNTELLSRLNMALDATCIRKEYKEVINNTDGVERLC
ncbi:arginine/ornithine ABC transporter [Polychaeton citri CBS 116435]|uniref:Arginine/ornithine ABC transporter n=1 Tax=Polychaeton citri CBS 116435 TaxID=1314669 RepID=A0A9P4Q040_9PEZI|nr:arginine/ornithine ABC transporter [Polychaeton citri CBS 116435]